MRLPAPLPGLVRRAVSVAGAVAGGLTVVASHVAAIATGFAMISGWLLITYAIAQLAPARVVWPASIGVLLISAAGWRPLFTIAADGLYWLTRERPVRKRA